MDGGGGRCRACFWPGAGRRGEPGAGCFEGWAAAGGPVLGLVGVDRLGLWCLGPGMWGVLIEACGLSEIEEVFEF